LGFVFKSFSHPLNKRGFQPTEQLNSLKNNSQLGGSLASIGRFELLCELESPLAEGVAKAFKNDSQGGVSLASVGRFAFLCGLEAPLVEGVVEV
jgi:hypothetical protein